MLQDHKKYVLWTVTTVAIFIAFGAGFLVGTIDRLPRPIQGIIKEEFGKPQSLDFSLFWDAWQLLHGRYVEPQKLNDQNLLWGAISGATKAIGDPYTVFLAPQSSKSFIQNITGSFGGIGAEIGKRNGFLTVIAPLEDSPAQKAGLRAGDKILKIEDTPTDDMTVEDAVNKIRGDIGTKIKLTVARGSDLAKTREVVITRAVIRIPIAKLTFKNDNKIAHLAFFEFAASAPAEFQKAATKILASSATKGIILDLRNNPGGFLEVAVNIAGWLLEPKSLVAIEDFGKDNQTKFYAEGLGALKDYPMVILVNQGSASASEILAGALRDARGIKLVGEKTFGKGSVQELTNLKDGSSIKITVAKWLTPKGTSISDQGLEPDYKVNLSEEDTTNQKDPQLDKAIEILSAMIK